MLNLILSVYLLFIMPPKPVSIENPWMREGLRGMNSAVYCIIKNNTGKDDQLLEVKSKSAKVVEVHETFTDGDKMGMRKAGVITIKANSSFEMKPGSYHIMLIKLIEDLKSGGRREIVFKFKNSGEVKVLADIKKQ